MNQRHVARFFAAALTFVVVGCGSTGGGCGGGCMEPIPGGYDGPKTPNSVVARLTPQAFDYINNNWKTLATTLVPGALAVTDGVQVPFDFPCTPVANAPTFGLVFVCNNGRGPGTTGFMDGKCDGNDSPCPILITIQNMKLSPQKVGAKNTIKADITLKLDATKDPVTGTNGRVYIDSKDKGWCWVWPIEKRLGAWVDFHSQGRGSRSNEVLSATIEFDLDNNWDHLMTFNVPNGISGIDNIEQADINMGGTDRCNSSNCPTTDDNRRSEDLCDSIAEIADFLKPLLINLLKPIIEDQVTNIIAEQRCRKCDPADPTVPKCPTGSTCNADKICMSSAAKGGKCVPMLLGMEGRMNLSSMLGDFGVDPNAKVDIFAAAGGQNSLDTSGGAFQTGLLGGAKAIAPAPCVADLPAPALQNVPLPNLQGEGPANHHVGLAVSQYFLNYAMYETHRSGALCLSIGSKSFSMLSTGLFKTFLPSLGTVAGTETRDAPMLVQLRPLAMPEVKIGEGTFDPVTKKPLKPLIQLALKDMSIDFFALIEDRYARIFTLTADIAVPLSLIVESNATCNQAVTPALGDLKQLITNIKTTNSEILAEDPQALAQLIPAILGMAEPALASALAPIAVPDMNGFRVKLDSLKGINQVSGRPDEYHHLGVFATLGVAGQCASYGPETFARLIASRIPSKEQMELRADRALPWPVAVVEVDSLDVLGNGRLKEYAWRVDGGLWSTWFDGPRLEIEHPIFLMQGKHVIEVRSRIAGETDMADPTPAQVDFVVDWEAPTVALRPDVTNNRLLVLSKDNVTPPGELEFAYRLGDEPLSGFGAAREIDLAAVEPFGSVEVQVRDGAGHVASATWKAPKLGSAIEDPSASVSAADASSSGFGCSAAGAGFGWAALGALALLRRRRSRN